MAGESAEQPLQSEIVNSLQEKFNTFVTQLHDHQGNKRYSHANDALMMTIDRLYREVPEGYHLQLGITPIKWFEFNRDRDLGLLAKKVQSPTGPKYYVEVARELPYDSHIEPGRSISQITVVGSNENKQNAAQIALMWSSKEKEWYHSGRSVSIDDLLSIEIVQDRPHTLTPSRP